MSLCSNEACKHTEEVPLVKKENGGNGKFFGVNRSSVLAMRLDRTRPECAVKDLLHTEYASSHG